VVPGTLHVAAYLILIKAVYLLCRYGTTAKKKGLSILSPFVIAVNGKAWQRRLGSVRNQNHNNAAASTSFININTTIKTVIDITIMTTNNWKTRPSGVQGRPA